MRCWLAGAAGAVMLVTVGCGQVPAPTLALDRSTAPPAGGMLRVITGAAAAGMPLPGQAARRQAAAEATSLMAEAVLPPGSSQMADLSGAAFTEPSQSIGCNLIEDDVTLWILPETAQVVSTFLLRHVPPSMTMRVSGGTTISGELLSDIVTDASSAPHGQDSELEFTFAPVGSKTGLRVDALAVPASAECASG